MPSGDITMPLSAQCSHCQASLKLADHLAGKRVKCPKCGQVFLAAAEVAALKSATTASKKEGIAKGPPPLVSAGKRTASLADDSRPRSKKRRDEDSEDDARPARSKRKRQQAGSNHMLLAVASGGGVLVVGIIVLFIVMSMRSRPAVAETPVVAKAKPAPVAPVANTNVADPPADPPPPQPSQPEATPPANVPNAAAPSQPAPPQAAPTTPTLVPGVSAKGLQPGSKIIVRTQIQGAPPGYSGDYNKDVKQTLEIAIANLGYQPVPEGGGGFILQVTAQMSGTGNMIQVKPLGPSAPPIARPKGKGLQPAPPQQTQSYPEEQITATIVLTDAQGTALWKNNSKFLSHSRILKTGNPALEMQAEMWASFNNWVRGPAIKNMR
jgi:predicted Zn finger-like uncharacterized protein